MDLITSDEYYINNFIIYTTCIIVSYNIIKDKYKERFYFTTLPKCLSNKVIGDIITLLQYDTSKIYQHQFIEFLTNYNRLTQEIELLIKLLF